MKEAFERVTKQRHVKAKYNQNLTEAQLYAGRAVDRDWYLDMISTVTKPEMAKGYRLRMEGTSRPSIEAGQKKFMQREIKNGRNR